MDVYSPPYPLPSMNPERVFQQLLELHDWVSPQMDWAAMEASRLHLQPEPFVPPLIARPLDSDSDRFMRLAVVDMYSSWVTMRMLRERYDETLRNYEIDDAWDSKPCIYHRLRVIQAASALLSVAFLPREKREAKEAETARRIQKEWMREFRKQMEEIRGTDDDEDSQGPDDEDDDIDYDKLFSPN